MNTLRKRKKIKQISKSGTFNSLWDKVGVAQFTILFSMYLIFVLFKVVWDYWTVVSLIESPFIFTTVCWIHSASSGNDFPFLLFLLPVKTLTCNVMKNLRMNALNCSLLLIELDKHKAFAKTRITWEVFSVSDSDRDQEDSHVFSQTRDPAVSKHRPTYINQPYCPYSLVRDERFEALNNRIMTRW